MQTTAGSWALQGSIVPRDAHVVARLRAAGAVLLGKATLSEWADMRTNYYSEGYSGRGGQCRSAYNLTVNPGGSSSGSGVGVGANVFPFALGTETDGSVINPAQRNAIVGFKPTVGLTSRGGVIPESLNQDTVGAFGKTVRDVTYVLDAIHGVDVYDNETSAQVGKTPQGGYAQFLTNRTALKGATFGIPWNSFWVYADAHEQEVLLELVSLIESAGATISYITPDYLSESRDGPAIAGILAIYIITTILLVCRFASRIFIVKSFGLDDGIAAFSWACFTAFMALCLVLINEGSGRHIEYIQYVLSMPEVEETEIVDFVAHLVYTATLYLCRMSGLAFFTRLCSSHPTFRISIWACGFFLTAAFMVQFFLILFHCLPV